MKTPILVLAMAAATLAGCTSTTVRDSLGIQDPTVLQRGIGAGQGGDAGAVTAEWVAAYGAVGKPREALANAAQRFDALPDGARSSYFAAKGRCWVAAATSELDARNGWGFVEEGIGEAARQLAMAEGREPLSAANAELRTSSVVRPDLWQAINSFKADPRINACPALQPDLGCAEVKLIHAGHDAWARDFTSAKRRADDVARQLAQVGAGIEACKLPAPPPVAVVPPKVTLQADATFGFGKGDESGLLAGGRATLDKLAADMRQAQDITHIDMIGYTDRIGSPAYNERLSVQRVETVKRYLEQRGVGVPISARGAGASNPLVSCEQRNRAALVECLAPNRRVELFIRKD